MADHTCVRSAKEVVATPERGVHVSHVETSPATKAPRPDTRLGVRHLQLLLVFLALVLSFALRVNMAVAIVAMTDSNNTNPDYPQYEWDHNAIGLIMSSYFWGFGVAHFPAGVLTFKMGAKPLLAGSLFCTSLFSMLTPLAARWGGWGLVVALQVLQGVSQGFVFPSTTALLAPWCPMDERGSSTIFVYSGCNVGTMLALTLGGVLSVSNAGWPSCFYTFGSVGVAWSVVWLVMGSNSPADHPSISQQERDYIQDSIGQSTTPNSKRIIPWKSILTSLPLWATIVANIGQVWYFWMLVTELPTFMKFALGFDLKTDGLLSSLPYLAAFLFSFVFGATSSFVNTNRVISVTASRKLFNTIGNWAASVFLIVFAYTTDTTTAIALLTLAVGFNVASYVGEGVNLIDLAPNFAGVLMGVSNGTANVVALFMPLVVSAVVSDYTSIEQWRIIFFITAGVSFATNAIYLIFATSVVQSWNEVQDENHVPMEVLGARTIMKDVGHVNWTFQGRITNEESFDAE